MPPIPESHELLHALVDWAQIVGAGATIVGVAALWAAFVTIRESRYATANGWMLELDKTLLEKHRLRREFFDESNKYNEFNHEMAAFTEYVADSLDFFLRHRFGVGKRSTKFWARVRRPLRRGRRVGIDGLQPSWENWVCGYFMRSSVLRGYLRANRDSFGSSDSALASVFEVWESKHNA
jgi:hypothetical protein